MVNFCKLCSTVRRQRYKEQQKQYTREYYLKNKERIIYNLRFDENGQRRIRKKDPEKTRIYNFRYAIRSRLLRGRRLTTQDRIHLSVTMGVRKAIGKKKAGRSERSRLGHHERLQQWENLVGYTFQDLMKHLESRFEPGMTWENYGRNGWHIDHVIPKSFFTITSVEDEHFKRCWSLNNLQPLWEADNIRKGAKICL